MFCVECGAEGKVYESVCEECFLKKHKLVELPDTLDFEMCKECGSFLVGSKWMKVPVERAIEMVLDEAMSYEKEVDSSRFTVELIPEDEMNFSIVVECDMYVYDLRTSKELQARVRLKPSQCVTCTRKKSMYYEAILQVRADGRDLAEEELDKITEVVHKRVEASTGTFISKEERMHTGLDFYMGSNDVARNLSKELANMYSAQEQSSPKLVGMKDGHDLYRVTYLVRLPQYKVGDVINYQGTLYQVRKMATTVSLMNLEDWNTQSFPPSELVGSRVEDCFHLDAVLLAQSDNEIQIMDPDTLKTVSIKKPEGFQPSGEEVSIVKCEKGIFIAPSQKD
jgi:nonsense-mediated mRNA decay protein 3